MKNNRKYAKPFEQWLREEVEIIFGITHVKKLASLDSLVLTTIELDEHISATIRKIHEEFFEYIDIYNEDELKMFVIANILNIVNFRSPKYRAFTQRGMEFTTKTTQNEDIFVKGVVELVVAVGKQTPQKPFFFLQEFKQSLKRNNDPLGQLLMAMLAAQINNLNQKTVYGCYVLGSSWIFVALEGKQYAETIAYDVKDIDSFMQIIRILKQQKMFIEQELNIE